jgi:uncharacterized protein YndB with AHSA1/START domain
MAVEPVVATVTVPCDPVRAFELFTDGIGRWWPSRTHSIGQDEVVAVVLEGRAGGRLYERWADGAEHPWGTVTVWEPPARFACTWAPSLEPEAHTLVEVSFEADGDATLVRLTHTGWEALGSRAAEQRAGYDAGWPEVLAGLVALSSQLAPRSP